MVSQKRISFAWSHRQPIYLFRPQWADFNQHVYDASCLSWYIFNHNFFVIVCLSVMYRKVGSFSFTLKKLDHQVVRCSSCSKLKLKLNIIFILFEALYEPQHGNPGFAVLFNNTQIRRCATTAKLISALHGWKAYSSFSIYSCISKCLNIWLILRLHYVPGGHDSHRHFRQP